MNRESKFINLKGLILTVLLSLLGAVISFAVAGPLGLLGIFWGSLLGAAVPAFFCGIIYVLITVKSPKIGTYFTFSFVFGLLFLISGSLMTAALFWIAGIVGEITMIGGSGKKWRPLVPYLLHWLMYTYAATFQMMLMPELVMKTYMSAGMDEATAKVTVDTYAAVYTAPQNMVIWGLCIAGAAAIGYFAGTKILRRHFAAAGVA